ncbi:MAG: hypothetical protein AABW73_04135 [Nanoarchaeota archaeon]
MVQDYETIISRIAESSNTTVEEVNRRVEAKRAKLSGLISKEGAAQIVAAELGISFDKQNVKINQIIEGMRRISLTAKIINTFPIRTYDKNGRSGKVLNIIVADETGNAKTVLWDINHIALFENGQISNGDTIEIANGSLRNQEIHLTAFSEIKKSGVSMNNVKTEITNTVTVVDKKIIDLKTMDKARMRCVIVQVFEPRAFEVCPQCSSRIKKEEGAAAGGECEKHGKVIPEKRVLINVVLDDGTETIRAVFFSDNVSKLGLAKNAEDYSEKREIILGKEAYFTGNVRQNKIFGTQEIVITDVEEIELDKLISQLEKH